MSRADRSGITVAARYVTLTVCAAALVTALVVAYRFARFGELPDGATAYTLGLLGIATALVASTRPISSDQPAASPAPPTDVA